MLTTTIGWCADGGLRAWGTAACKGAPAAPVAVRELGYARMGKAPFKLIGTGRVASGAEHAASAHMSERMHVACSHAWNQGEVNLEVCGWRQSCAKEEAHSGNSAPAQGHVRQMQ